MLHLFGELGITTAAAWTTFVDHEKPSGLGCGLAITSLCDILYHAMVFPAAVPKDRGRR
jgi:hypothetical protein